MCADCRLFRHRDLQVARRSCSGPPYRARAFVGSSIDRAANARANIRKPGPWEVSDGPGDRMEANLPERAHGHRSVVNLPRGFHLGSTFPPVSHALPDDIRPLDGLALAGLGKEPLQLRGLRDHVT